jgi:hypothetical protein
MILYIPSDLESWLKCCNFCNKLKYFIFKKKKFKDCLFLCIYDYIPRKYFFLGTNLKETPKSKDGQLTNSRVDSQNCNSRIGIAIPSKKNNESEWESELKILENWRLPFIFHPLYLRENFLNFIIKMHY